MENKLPLTIPYGWKMLKDKYELKNDQGLDFVANLLCPSDNVVSIFKAKKGIKAKTFEMMIYDYEKITPSLKLVKKFNLKFGQESYPIYIIEGENNFLMAQTFFEKEVLLSAICTLKEKGKSFDDYSTKNPVLGDIVRLIRSNI